MRTDIRMDRFTDGRLNGEADGRLYPHQVTMDGAKMSFLHVSQNVPTDSPMEVKRPSNL